MIDEWLHILQRDYRLYNIDTQHQCLAGKNRASIIRIFPGVSNFYGCVVCGQFHLCHLTERCGCVVYTDTISQRLTCLYSGLLLKESVAYQMKECDSVIDSTLPSSAKSHATFGAKKLLYTNMNAPKIEEPDEVSEHSEKYHTDSQSSDDDAVVDELKEAEQEDEMMKIDAIPMQGKFNNRAYWNEYYQFLYSFKVAVIPPPPPPPPPAPITEVSRNLGVEEKVADRVRLLIDMLLRQHKKLQSSLFEQVKKELIAYYVPVTYRFVLLVYERLKQPKLNDLCDAILLELLRDSYSREDQCGYRIEIWHRDVWLKELYDTGLMSQLFGDKKRKKKPFNLNKTNIKTMASLVLQSLSLYHANWLRQFINS